MQIKVILFVVVVGAVAVLAKKGSSEEDGNDYGVMNVWPYPRPGNGPKPFKFKGSKHQIYFIGRPEYQQQAFYPQGNRFPHRPHFPHGSQEINPLQVQQYLGDIQKEMQEFAARAYKEFQVIENEIGRNRQQLEDILRSQFQTLELSLEAKQEKEIQQALKDGKDELKIQECMADEEHDFRAEMDADIQRTTDCINDATERALKIVASVRNAYTESSVMSSVQAREWGQRMRLCAEQRNHHCIEKGMFLINQKTKSTVQEGIQHFQKLQEVPRQQTIQFEYCRQNFRDDLKEMKNAYSQMVKQCVIASETKEPKEDAKEEKGKVNVNVEVKPEAEVEVKPEAEVAVKPEVEVAVKPEVEVAVKPEAEVEVKPEAEVEVKLGAEVEV